jgi:ankyrin repeat protein
VDHNGFNAVHKAVPYGHINVIEYLMAEGMSINAKNDMDGMTPLSLAASYQVHDMVRFLLQNGAHVNDTDDTGATALNHA